MRFLPHTCRYCQRYGRPCGRRHSLDTISDWSRDWAGNPRPVVAEPERPIVSLHKGRHRLPDWWGDGSNGLIAATNWLSVEFFIYYGYGNHPGRARAS